MVDYVCEKRGTNDLYGIVSRLVRKGERVERMVGDEIISTE